MKIGDRDITKGNKALTTLPGKPESIYDVGYGKPPAITRFKPGQSGNPSGRPKGRKNKGIDQNQERLKSILLEEAYRSVTINDGNRQISIPMAQAVVRSLAVNAAKGNPRAQRLFAEMLAGTEASNKQQYDMLLETAINYKVEWDRELERRRILNLDLPAPIPHPDHIQIDFRTGKVHIMGPMTREEKAERELWASRKPGFEDELAFLQAQLDDPAFASRRPEIMKDIRQTQRVLEMLGEISGEK